MPFVDGRSIPAGAGEPQNLFTGFDNLAVYPRGCGGTYHIGKSLDKTLGLSPRVRGNLLHRLRATTRGVVGSIPAGAGEPPLPVLRGLSPRVRGNLHHNGLSPRVRGNLLSPWHSSHNRVYPRGCGGTKSIPAGAGEPYQCPGAGSIPAGAGEPCCRHGTRSTCRTGLSPRVRGNQDTPFTINDSPGSIPAGAGEPAVPFHRYMAKRVYPRGCGGTPAQSAEWTFWGRKEVYPRGCGGTRHEHRRRSRRRVYPRGCGGTDLPVTPYDQQPGLSPRVRGNLVFDVPRPERHRSIPAGAGEPLVGGGGLSPRVRGNHCHNRSLSPRVRGNPARFAAVSCAWSIPAGAGEPDGT